MERVIEVSRGYLRGTEEESDTRIKRDREGYGDRSVYKEEYINVYKIR